MSGIGERVKARRKELGLSQVVVAKQAGMTQGNLSDLERGRNTTTINLLAIAKALSVDPMWLQFGEGKAPILTDKLKTNAAHNSHKYVLKAIKDGYLPRLSGLSCVDCGAPAKAYDHRDYNRPLDVEPVCHACNVKRGPAIPFVHVNDR